MAQTPSSSDVPYVSNLETLDFYAQPWLADMMRATPAAPPPSFLAICDTNNPAGARLYKHLMIGAGEIEAFCTVSKRYTPADLDALTGVSEQLLKKLNAARGVWSLAQYLKPLTARPEEVPMALESFKLLDMLNRGEAIFGLLESQEAGLPSVQRPNPAQLKTPNVVARAARLFPNYGINQIWPGPNSQG